MNRSVVVYVLVTVLLAVGGVVSWRTWSQIPTAAAPGQDGWVSTQWGPLGPADRDLLAQVRLAGLWEMPVGQQLVERASSKAVRDAGDKIAREHMDLDQLTRDTAAKLGVLLPNQPTPEKQAWMNQISAASGSNFDWMAVNLLRQAHGSVLPTIINVRVGTRNSLVREFADQAAQYVNRHINYLESTGLVDFGRLDQPPDPPRAVVTRDGQYENVPVALLALSGLVVLAGAGALVFRLLTKRRRAVVVPTAHTPHTRERSSS